MDPLENVRVDHDSTFALMLEWPAARPGGPRAAAGVAVRRGTGGAGRRARQCAPSRVQRKVGGAFPGAGAMADGAPSRSWTSLFLRKDPAGGRRLRPPPRRWWSWDRGPLLINHPRGPARRKREAVRAPAFPRPGPHPTLGGGATLARLRAFIDAQGGDGVVKPLDGLRRPGRAAGPARRSQSFLAAGDRDQRAGPAFRWWRQAYLPRRARRATKRIILLGGEPLGAVLARTPRKASCGRTSLRGGSAAPAPLTPRDREICRSLAPALNELGLWFVGIDVIGGKLTEGERDQPPPDWWRSMP